MVYPCPRPLPQCLGPCLALKNREKSVEDQAEHLKLHHNLRLEDGTGLGEKEGQRGSDESVRAGGPGGKGTALRLCGGKPRGSVKAGLTWKIPAKFITEGLPGEAGVKESRVGQETGRKHTSLCSRAKSWSPDPAVGLCRVGEPQDCPDLSQGGPPSAQVSP